MEKSEFLWVEKYRPRTLSDVVLPQATKDNLAKFVEKGEIPNLILSGGPGIGKTTTAKAMVDDIGCDWIVINGSLHGNIDTLRTEIMNFASSVSFTGGRKYVILDEADYLNPQSTQPALRNFMEEYSKNCGFILTCNYPNRIIEPLHSRCSTIDFKIANDDKAIVAKTFLDRIETILSKEDIDYDKKVLAQVIMSHFPDFRKVLNQLQQYSAIGIIDLGILNDLSEDKVNEVIGHIKSKRFTEMRKWVGQNLDSDPVSLLRTIYDKSNEFVEQESIPQLVLTIAEYQYKAAFVADQEVNLVACLTTIMAECDFK